MSKTIRVPDTVYAEVERLVDRYDYTKKEAIRHMVREGGYDV